MQQYVRPGIIKAMVSRLTSSSMLIYLSIPDTRYFKNPQLVLVGHVRVMFSGVFPGCMYGIIYLYREKYG